GAGAFGEPGGLRGAEEWSRGAGGEHLRRRAARRQGGGRGQLLRPRGPLAIGHSGGVATRETARTRAPDRRPLSAPHGPCLRRVSHDRRSFLGGRSRRGTRRTKTSSHSRRSRAPQTFGLTFA